MGLAAESSWFQWLCYIQKMAFYSSSPCLLSLTLFLFSLLPCFWALEKGVYMSYCGMSYLYLEWPWVYVLTAIYCKEKLLWLRLRIAFAYGYSTLLARQFYAMLFLLDNIRKFLPGVYTFPSHMFLTGSTLLDTNSLMLNSPQIHLENSWLFP